VLPQTGRTPQLPSQQLSQSENEQLDHPQQYLPLHLDKVLSKLGISLALEDIRRLSNSTPMAVESLLYLLKQVVDEHNKQKEEDQRSYPNPYEYSG
jgi:hypothetical protein